MSSDNKNCVIKHFDESKENETIVITFNNQDAEYPYCWLRDNCRCEECYHSKINQRLKHTLDIPLDTKPVSIEMFNGKLKIIWNDNHESFYSDQFLYESSYESWRRNQIVERVMWAGHDIPKDVVYVDRDEFLKSEECLKKFLASLLKFGVAFVDNVHPTLEDTELVIRRVAPPQRTLFGDMWEFTSNMDRADTAYTNIPLASHTDGTYLVESPGLQVLHCLKHIGTGGYSTAVDGFYVANLLHKNNPKYYKTLTEEIQPARYEEEGWSQYHCDPVINIDSLTKQIKQIRYNVYDRTSHCISKDPKKIKQMHEALREFGLICESEKMKWIFKLNPGRVFFFDNWRILHGRTEFTGQRILGGSYVTRSDWLSAARTRGLITRQ